MVVTLSLEQLNTPVLLKITVIYGVTVVQWKFIDVSEEDVASIFTVKE
jgi:hypothetical protein